MNNPLKKCCLFVVGMMAVWLVFQGVQRCFPAAVDAYAIESTEQKFGGRRIKTEYEQFIRNLAQEMGITKPFHIRKTNQAMLCLGGYFNAFVTYPMLLDFIPISNQTFLYISEGFFEDLSLQEQRFVIGHELIHVKEGHARYYILTVLFLSLLILIWAVYWLYPRMKQLVEAWAPSSYTKPIAIGLFILALSVCALVREILSNAYRCRQEWQADRDSTALLNSHDGGCAFTDRVQKEFGLASHNPYYGLFADHPSWHERKHYFLTSSQLPLSKESL